MSDEVQKSIARLFAGIARAVPDLSKGDFFILLNAAELKARGEFDNPNVIQADSALGSRQDFLSTPRLTSEMIEWLRNVSDERIETLFRMVKKEGHQSSPSRKRSNDPKFDLKRGEWRGGDTKTLYAFTDERTGQTIVRPGGAFAGVGPAMTVRMATRSEAEELWQSPLHSGWKVE